MSYSVAVCTPWLDHLELWPDYHEAIDAGRPDETIIVDNHSDPKLDFATVRMERNAGFTVASNVAMKLATADVVVFLNNDIALISRGWVDMIRDRVEPGVLVGARVRQDPHTAVDGRVIPYLDGWCLAGMRSDLVELGGFDETLAEPAYYADNLLCLEARAAGMTLREAPIGLTHKSGVTSKPGVNAKVGEATVANRARYTARVRQLLAVAA